MLKNYFKDWSNYLSFAIALVPTTLLYIYPPGTKVPFFAFVLLLFCFVLSLWLNVKFFLDSRDEHRPAIELLQCSNGRILCRPNNLLTHHSIVSFYENDRQFEKLICYGYVEIINGKGLAQILPYADAASSEKLFIYISSKRNKIIVKPTITTDMLDNINESGNTF